MPSAPDFGDPTAPKALRAVWTKIPLAKRRLLAYGPLSPGRASFQTACVVIAAELALHGIEQEVAVTACEDMPFTADTTPREKVLKSVAAWVKWAYHPPSGTPIMSGCPRSGRTSGGVDTSRMRDSFRAYCEGGCQMTCSSFRLNAMPELNLVGTAYESAIISHLWMPVQSAGGLGSEARRLYAIIASMAVAEGSDKVRAASTYLIRRVGGDMSSRTVRHHLAKLKQHGLIRTLNKHTALIYVPPLSDDQLSRLLAQLGVHDAARWNVIAANHESLRKAEEFPSWDLDEAKEALGLPTETTRS